VQKFAKVVRCDKIVILRINIKIALGKIAFLWGGGYLCASVTKQDNSAPAKRLRSKQRITRCTSSVSVVSQCNLGPRPLKQRSVLLRGLCDSRRIFHLTHLYLQHPITRFHMRYLQESPERIYERNLHYLNIEQEKIALRYYV